MGVPRVYTGVFVLLEIGLWAVPTDWCQANWERGTIFFENLPLEIQGMIRAKGGKIDEAGEYRFNFGDQHAGSCEYEGKGKGKVKRKRKGKEREL
jgi:hypothetical protein